MTTWQTRPVNLVVTGVLFFSFSIVVLASQGIGLSQRIIAYTYLFLSVLSVVWALLPWRPPLTLNSWIYPITWGLTVPAWWFVFAMRWINGIHNTRNIEHVLVFVAGVIWLFCLLIATTRALTGATRSANRIIQWMPLSIPLYLFVQALVQFAQCHTAEGFWLLGFTIGTTLVASRLWNPPIEMPF